MTSTELAHEIKDPYVRASYLRAVALGLKCNIEEKHTGQRFHSLASPTGELWLCPTCAKNSETT